MMIQSETPLTWPFARGRACDIPRTMMSRFIGCLLLCGCQAGGGYDSPYVGKEHEGDRETPPKEIEEPTSPQVAPANPSVELDTVNNDVCACTDGRDGRDGKDGAPGPKGDPGPPGPPGEAASVPRTDCKWCAPESYPYPTCGPSLTHIQACVDDGDGCGHWELIERCTSNTCTYDLSGQEMDSLGNRAATGFTARCGS